MCCMTAVDWIEQICPLGFKVAAGGACASLPPPPPNPCPDLFHNGDLDGDGQLTVQDLDTIANFVIEQEDLNECEQFVADGTRSVRQLIMTACQVSREKIWNSTNGTASLLFSYVLDGNCIATRTLLVASKRGARSPPSPRIPNYSW